MAALEKAMFTKSTSVAVVAMTTVLFSLAGCPGRELSRVVPQDIEEFYKSIPVRINRDVDILFVVDNSGSMREEQSSLAENFPEFIKVLQTIEGGLPNVHIGVISTDVGAGRFSIATCRPNGDNGNLQANAADTDCNTPGPEPFLVDVADTDGNRVTNYEGDLAESFSCIAKLGTEGCGFEQPLEAVRRALENNPANAGFIRPNAYLAIVFITDEDDCSAIGDSVFDTSSAAVANLGPPDSYRCFAQGVICDPDVPNEPGVKTNCRPRDDSEYLHNVRTEYVDYLRQLKGDPGLIITAAIMGSTPDQLSVQAEPLENGQSKLKLTPSCQSSGFGVADPPVRLQWFLDQFPNRSTTTEICDGDLSPALTQIAALLKDVIGNPCLAPNAATSELTGLPVCSVKEITNPRGENRIANVIAACSSPANAASEAPCWQVEKSNQCPTATGPGSSIVIERNGVEPLPNTYLEVRCETTLPENP